MTISVGDKLPEVTMIKATAEGPQPAQSAEFFAGKKVALFSVPGAFTPTCSAKHLPGFIEHQQQIRDQGVDAIACMSVNDTFVMHAWGQQASAEGIDMLADGNGEFAEKLGLDLDATAWGMGFRSQRFAMLVDDGVVKELLVEAPGEFSVSSAEHVLQVLGG